MTPCARSCCWVPMAGVCAKARTCPCHWDERAHGGLAGTAGTHRDPTANEAIGNVMKERRGK